MKVLDIFIDGSCLGNPGPGGYCIIIKYNKNYEKIISKGYYLTTNNRMEIMSAIIALEYLNKNFFLNIKTDSQYLRQGITNWIFKWEKHDWHTANNKKVKNIDLWMRLFNLIKKYKINWQWIKGHNGDKNNERCDKIARLSANNPCLQDFNYLKLKKLIV